MQEAQDIASSLIKKFPTLEGKVKATRTRRIFADVEYSMFAEFFEYIVKEDGFTQLCTITGLDELTSIAVVYHMANDEGVVLNVKTNINRDNPVLKSVTGYFLQAALFERELVDLLGVKVEGLPEGKRYPLPDDWPVGQYPLRKDWKPQSSDK